MTSSIGSTADYSYGTMADKEMIETKMIDLESKFLSGVAELEASNKSIIDCIVTWCFKEGIEIEMVAPLVLKNMPLLCKVEQDGERLNFLKPVRRVAI